MLKNIFDKRLLKFIIVGIINTLVGSTIMFLLYNFTNFNYWLSSVCNYIFTSILSFSLNKYFTFNVRSWSVFMIFTFILTVGISYLIAYGIAKHLIDYFLHKRSQKFRENAALFTGMCLFTCLNYLGQRLIVFRNKGESNEY